MNTPRRAVLAAALTSLARPSLGQRGPEGRPARIMVPFPPGTPPDVLARLLSQFWGEADAARVVIDNRPGALGAIGAAEVLRLPADGQTLMTVTTPQAVTMALMPEQRIDLLRDFVPVARLSRGWNVLVVHPDLPVRSLAELTALLRAKPDRYNFPSPGYGTPAHLIGELYQARAGVRAIHVPYQQFSQAIADLLNGTNQFMFVTTLPVLDRIAAGRLRALAVTAPYRLSVLPDVPTAAEAGLAGIEMEDWVGLVAHRATAEPPLVAWREMVKRALASPTVRTGFAKLGLEVSEEDGTAFATFMARTVTMWDEVIRERGIRIPR